MKLHRFIFAIFCVATLSNCSIFNSSDQKINISVVGNDLIFSLPKNTRVLEYEIKDYQKFEKDGLTYKKIFALREINKRVDEISFKNYKSKGILDNHAYYILLGADGINKTGSRLAAVGFCLHQEKILQQYERDSTESFIEKCRNFKLK